MHAEPYPRTAGFTLLEVLVALAVVALALGAALHALGVGVDTGGYLRERTLAHWVAMNAANELALATPTPGRGVRTGSETLAARTWHWRARVEGTDDETVNRVVITVEAQEDGEPKARLVTYLSAGP